MSDVANLLERPVYGLAQVDRLLGLSPGTARRWIDGYERAGKKYPPVVRLEPTGEELVTWGEFVETRLLSEYRDAGVPIVHLRPTVDRLRERLVSSDLLSRPFDPRYPLAHAHPFLDVDGREIVQAIQDEVGLEKRLRFVVVRNDQLVLSPEANKFVRAADFHGGIATRLRALPDVDYVWFDPLRQFGEPVVRSVPTDVIAEQIRAGDSIEMIADFYELDPNEIQAAIRYELIRGKPESESVA